MELLPLITIPVIYFLIALIKPYVQPRIPFNICAICTAVSATWFGMLLAWLFGTEIPLITLAILMGMSITGIMYKMEDFYKKAKIRNFWFVRLVVIVGGYFLIYELLKKEFDIFLFIFIASLIIVAIASLLFQGTTHKEVVEEQKKAGRKTLIKRLEDCC